MSTRRHDRPHLELIESDLSKRLILVRESFENDRISSFAVQLDLAVRSSDQRRHSFPRTVEFADIENLKLLRFAQNFDED